MSKYLKKILLVSMLIIIIPIIAYAQVSHPASEITPGTFGGLATDAFSFPGNVGIGVTSPTFALDVFNANTQKHAAAVFSSNNPATWIAFQSAGTTGDLPQIGVIGNMLQLQTSGTGQLSITPEGNVGIGMSTPNAKLYVEGSRGGYGIISQGANVGIFGYGINGMGIFGYGANWGGFFQNSKNPKNFCYLGGEGYSLYCKGDVYLEGKVDIKGKLSVAGSLYVNGKLIK